MQGLHLAADLVDCRCDPAWLLDAARGTAEYPRWIRGSCSSHMSQRILVRRGAARALHGFSPRKKYHPNL